MRVRRGAGWVSALVLATTVLLARQGAAYSVQTHEQLVDLAWKPAIVPVLLSRYPQLTRAQLVEAHAYAYGGCAIQDVGYYPLGSQFFSNLTHYVRSGDFVRALLRNAKTPDELAFAIGALTHFDGDALGHAEATNPSVAKEFPELARRYGPSVSYEQSPHAHVRVEFAFDIDQISKHRFAPSAYLSHVGLEVANDLLTRSFFEVYGLTLRSVLGGSRERPALSGYRFAVRRLLPRVAYAENVLHRHRMPAEADTPEVLQLKAALAQSEFENGWNPYRKKPGIGTYSLAGLIWILPKIGPLALLGIKGPTAETQAAYTRSMNATIAGIAGTLGDLKGNDDRALRVALENRDLDTGAPTRPGTYRLTDQTYAELLRRVMEERVEQAGKKQQPPVVPEGLKADILRFYADPAAPSTTRNDAKRWAEVQRELALLRTMQTRPEPDGL